LQQFRDLDASPQTWGDFAKDRDPNTDYLYEWTPNYPGNGRFDADSVPFNSVAVTVSGSSGSSGSFPQRELNAVILKAYGVLANLLKRKVGPLTGKTT
jgi:hypothetical protein